MAETPTTDGWAQFRKHGPLDGVSASEDILTDGRKRDALEKTVEERDKYEICTSCGCMAMDHNDADDRLHGDKLTLWCSSDHCPGGCEGMISGGWS